MIPAAPRRASGGLLALLLGACLLTGCTGSVPDAPRAPGSTPRPSPPEQSTPSPRATSRAPLPVPTETGPSSLPASPHIRLAPVRSSPDDLARVDIRDGNPRSRSASATLPSAKGFTVTAGCTGAPGTVLHWAVVAKKDDAFLFGSTTPCNGAFLTDAGLEVAHEVTPARLEVTLVPGVDEATVVLRRAVG